MVKCKTSAKYRTPNLHQTQHFKGVRMRKWGKWVSEVRIPNSRGRIWLGTYDSPDQAARAYDCAVYCLRGSNAKFNFPDSLPEIPSASSFSPAQIRSFAAKFAVAEIPKTAYSGATLSGTESQSCVEGQQDFEEPDWALLDLLLEDIEDILPSDEALQDLDFFMSLADAKTEGDLSPANEQKAGIS